MILSVLLSAVLAMVGSWWIDRLYSVKDAPLSFPNRIVERSRFRVPLLAFGLAACMTFIVERPTVEAIYLTIAAFFLLSITATDFEQYVIFDRMTLPFAVAGLIATIHLQLPIIDHLIAAAAGGTVFLLLALLTKGALGGGDIKLIAALGLWVGTDRLIDIVVYGSIFGGIAALIMLATKKMNRKSVFAYGPYFTLAALFFLLTG